MLLEVRCALEELGVQLACDRIDKSGVRELHEAADHFRDMLESDDITQIAEADEAFHDVIFKATDNGRLDSAAQQSERADVPVPDRVP